MNADNIHDKPDNFNPHWQIHQFKKGDRLTFCPATSGPVIFTRSGGQPGAAFEITAHEIRFRGGSGGGNNHQPEPVAAEEGIDFS